MKLTNIIKREIDLSGHFMDSLYSHNRDHELLVRDYEGLEGKKIDLRQLSVDIKRSYIQDNRTDIYARMVDCVVDVNTNKTHRLIWKEILDKVRFQSPVILDLRDRNPLQWIFGSPELFDYEKAISVDDIKKYNPVIDLNEFGEGQIFDLYYSKENRDFEICIGVNVGSFVKVHNNSILSAFEDLGKEYRATLSTVASYELNIINPVLYKWNKK